MSSGMQYTQRRLQASVSETRRVVQMPPIGIVHRARAINQGDEGHRVLFGFQAFSERATGWRSNT